MSTRSSSFTSPVGAASGAVNGRGLMALIDTLTVEEVDFTSLRGVTPDQILTSDFRASPLHELLHEMVGLTKKSMTKMNLEYPGIPVDSAAKTIDLMTRPGSHVVVLKGVVPEEADQGAQVLGYGILISGRENFPDADRIPEHLFTSNAASRVIRLFVSEDARALLPFGEAFSRILNGVKTAAKEGPAIGMVLTDIVATKGEVPDGRSNAIWLEAKQALEVRGFEDTEESLTETFSHGDGTEVAVRFRWYVWPPRSDSPSPLVRAYRERFEGLERATQERLAAVTPSMPLIDGRISVSGSSADAYSVARLYPGNLVVGDVGYVGTTKPLKSANLVLLDSSAGYGLNPSSVDASLVIGVLPDVAGSSRRTMSQNVTSFLSDRVEELRPGGALVIRDTVATPGPLRCRVTFEDVRGAAPSVAELFRRFVADPREEHLGAAWKRGIQEVSLPGSERASFVAPWSVVNEFLLKYPYHRDWDFERFRSYTRETGDARAKTLGKLGLRVLYSGPERSAWFASHYLDGKVDLTDVRTGASLPFPATNHVTIAEKVDSGEGVRMVRRNVEIATEPRFVSLRVYEARDITTGESLGKRDVVSRPNETHDIVPYTIHRGQIYVRGRIYKRPIALEHESLLDGGRTGGYLVEQIAAIADPETFKRETTCMRSAIDIVGRRAGVPSSEVVDVHPPTRYFVRPDSVDEQVFSQAVRITHLLEDCEVHWTHGDMTGRTTIRMFDGRQILQGCQTGSIQDARMERKIYELLSLHGMERGPWLGSKFSLPSHRASTTSARSFADVSSTPPDRTFALLPGETPQFLEVRRGVFEELDSQGVARSEYSLEYVQPGERSGFSASSLSIIPLAKIHGSNGGEEICLGVQVQHLPAVQERTGNPTFVSVPLFRVPLKIKDIHDAKLHARDRIGREFGYRVNQMIELGGRYFVSPGVTPEVVHPLAVEFDVTESNGHGITWVPLRELLEHSSEIQCAQLLTGLFRATHMLGIER